METLNPAQSINLSEYLWTVVICTVFQQEFHAVFGCLYMCVIRDWCAGAVGAALHLQVTACTAS